MTNELLIIRGTKSRDSETVIYCEVYGTREAVQLMKAYEKFYPDYKFTMRAQ